MEFKKSNHIGKKYMVYYNNKWIHFGQLGYDQYEDRVPLKLYTHLNHYDKKRRASYLARAKGIRDGKGNLTWNNKNSPNYWAVNYLW